MSSNEKEAVNHPAHYNNHPSGIECIEVVRHMSFNVGNAVKYLWRADHKHESPIEDLRKAQFYINDEIERLIKIEVEKQRLQTEKIKLEIDSERT